MIKIILALIISFILILLQSSLCPYLGICNAFPNLILLLILVSSISQGHKKTLVWVIFGGFFLDVFSFNNPIGTSILVLFLISYLVSFLSQNIFKRASIFSMILFGIGGTLIYRFLLILILLITGLDFQLSFSQLISQIVYNTALLIPLFYSLKRIKWQS